MAHTKTWRLICITTKTNPKKPAKKKRWLSPSSINTYLRCPRKFYLQYNKKLKTKPNIHLLRGSAVHKTLERFFREGYADSGDYAYYDDTRNAILSLFNDEWRSRKDQLLRLDLKEQDLSLFYSDSVKMILNFLHDNIKSNETNRHTPWLEQTIFSKKWMLMGRMDAIYSARDPPLIIDWKTCKSIDFTDDYKRQMGIYALLYEDKYNQKPITAIHYLKFLDGLRKFNISEDFMEDLKNTILEVHHKTMSTDEGDYPCKCGGWCEKDLLPVAET